MKKLLYVVAGLVLVFFIYRGIYNSTKTKETSNATPKKIEFETHIKSNEPSVQDFVINDANVLYISVKDDGTDRTGLASYFCELASDYNLKLFKVKVVKYGSQNSPKKDNVYGILLGETQCN